LVKVKPGVHRGKKGEAMSYWYETNGAGKDRKWAFTSEIKRGRREFSKNPKEVEKKGRARLHFARGGCRDRDRSTEESQSIR